MHPDELIGDNIFPFVPRADEIDQDKDQRLASVAKVLCECSSVHAAATHLMTEEPWDFMGVYHDAIDHFCHGFMKFHPPRRPFIPEADYELYNNVVTAGYLFHDMMLQVMLTLAGPDTLVILCSDHGFHPDHLRPSTIPNEPAGPAVEHRDFGVLVMSGPGVKRDQRVYGTSLLDITPTILAHYGLPVGEDMDGRALVEAFEQPPELTSIPTWDEVEGDAGTHPPDLQIDTLEAKEALEQLVALGYVERPDENRELAIERTVRELNYNLARSYMDAGMHAEAEPILVKMYQKEPSQHRFGLHLAMCLRAMDRISELGQLVAMMRERREEDVLRAREELREVGELSTRRAAEYQAHRQAKRTEEGLPEPAEEPAPTQEDLFTDKERDRIKDLRAMANLETAAFDFLSGCVYVAEGNLEQAVEAFQHAIKAAPQRVPMHINIGEAYLQLKSWEDAVPNFRRAIELDPDSPHARLGLARALLLRRRNVAAAEEALKAVGLLYFYPMAHYCLGVALHRIGRLERAVEALEVALAQNPNFFEAHERLAHIYARRLDEPGKAEEHRALAREIRRDRKRRSATSADVTLPILTPPEAPEEWSEGVEAFHDTVPTARPTRVPRLANTPRSRIDAEPLANGEKVVTVVSGLPRSGTSMMMQMLAAGGIEPLTDGERTADDDNPRGYFELESAKRLRTDHEWIGGAAGKVIKVVSQLLPLLPLLPLTQRYQVVLMERNLDEVLASQRRMLERRGEVGADLADHRLRTLFERQVVQVERLLKGHQIPTLRVSYREAVDTPRDVAHTLNAFLGGGLDEAAMASSVAPDLYRQRRSAP